MRNKQGSSHSRADNTHILFFQLRQHLFHAGRQEIAGGQDQRFVASPVDGQAVLQICVIPFKIGEHISGQKIIADLAAGQGLGNLLQGHAGPHPVALGAIQNGYVGLGFTAFEQGAHAVHVGHQRPEMPVLLVVSMGEEMGRAVGIGVFLHAESVGHKMVHAPHQEVIGQVFFQPHALLPTVITEDFAQAIALLNGINRRQGRA